VNSDRAARWSLGRFAILFLILTAAFFYRGPGYPILWSIAIFIVVVQVVARMIAPLIRKQEDDVMRAALSRVAAFRPHVVRIYPTRALFVEYGLVDAHRPADDPSWVEALEPGWVRPGWTHPGIGFTRLTEDVLDDNGLLLRQGLVYWNDFKTFSTDVEGNFSIIEPSAAETLMHPRIRLERRSEGLVIKLATVEDIREHVRGPEGADEPGRELAILPWTEFLDEHELIAELVLGRRDVHENHMKDVRRIRDEGLVKHGWKREDDHPPLGHPYRLTHKYFLADWHFI